MATGAGSQVMQSQHGKQKQQINSIHPQQGKSRAEEGSKEPAVFILHKSTHSLTHTLTLTPFTTCSRCVYFTPSILCVTARFKTSSV